METLDAALAWLQGLPRVPLYAIMGMLAAIENIFPPIPADVMVAFGAFLAARGGDAAWPPFLAVWVGNIAGAGAMFWLGRRYGAATVERRFHLDKGGRGDARILGWYQRFGVLAFFVTRFVPGLRAIVPPVAGALRIPATGALLAMGAASGLWYGAITWFAFRAGANWEVLRGTIGQLGTWSAVTATVVLAAGVGGLVLSRRRARATRPPA